MNIFDALLDKFKLESTREIENSQVEHQKPENSINGTTLPITIKRYWISCKPDHRLRNYREPSYDEMAEFAKADVLSCFEKPRNNESLSDFHLGKIGVTNWYNFFDVLFYSGYLRKATISESLNSCTLKELKILADSIGVKKSGKKSDLVERICAVFSENDLNKIIPEDLFIISEKGKEYLNAQEDLVLLSTHAIFDVSLSEFNDKRFIGNRKRNFYDTMFQVLNEQKYFYEINKNYLALTVVCFRIYDIMVEEFECTEHNVPIDILLTNYIEYLYLCTCLPSEARNLVEDISVYDVSHISLPTIKTNLAKFQDYKSLINFNVIFANKPPSFMTKKEFINMINEIFDTPLFDCSKWNKILQNNFKKYMFLFKK